jgi:hypothetical protein
LRDENKARALAEAIAALREGHRLESMVYPVTPVSFRQVPGSPFAYWVSEGIRRLFTELPAFESDSRTVRQGLATADDFRFVRAWWEVASECVLDGANGPDWREDIPAFQDWCRHRTFEGKRWVPFAKGGTFSPYYADLHLVVNWERNGEEMKAWADPLYGNSGWSRIIKSVDFYFRPGLTFLRRTFRFCPVVLPSGSIFSDGGQAIFTELRAIPSLLGLVSSCVFDFLVKMIAGRTGDAVQFMPGMIANTPIPKLKLTNAAQLDLYSTNAIKLLCSLSRTVELSHLFYAPALLYVAGNSLPERLLKWQVAVSDHELRLAEQQCQIDDLTCDLYGITSNDRRAIENSLNELHLKDEDEEQSSFPYIEGQAEAELTADGRQLVADLLSYSVGCVFGRWNVCFATGQRQPPELPAPFAPLPVCSPGMLTGEDRLPLREVPQGYPLRIDQDGILVDDPDNPDDTVRRVREVLEVLWPERADAIERETCELLGVRELRDYFRKPGKGGFWDDHVSRYSKSRRKAPIYWLLQSSKKNYALWMYYHRFDKDMLFKALLNYVEPKIRLEESRLEPLRAQRTAAGTSGKGVKMLEKEIDRQEEFISEVRDFAEKLRRVANLHLDPDLNDGVVLNIAPLWELVPWKESKKYWEELRDGEYEWSSIGKQLRQKGIAQSP